MSGTSSKPRCGLCGKSQKRMQTDGCGNWICDDHQKYVLFSYARNSCARNHDRYTLCAFHHHNGHKGHWKDCRRCRESFPTEIYVWYGTNEYNFEVLENPPHYEPTKCDRCGVVIKLGTDGYSQGPEGTQCDRCTHEAFYTSPSGSRAAISRKPKPRLPANDNPNAIEIVLSAQAQKRWRVKPTVSASDPAAHWLGQWRVDFGQKQDRTWLALATNVATLYTFIFPLKGLRPDNFEKLFRVRLGLALADAPVLEGWKDAPLIFVKGNPRMAVGSMNDMRKLLAWRVETGGSAMTDDEDRVNMTPFLSLQTHFPEKEFARQLVDGANSDQAMNPYP